MGTARSDHRQAILELRYTAIENNRSFYIDHFLDCIIELTRFFASDAVSAVGLRHLYEIRYSLRVRVRQADLAPLK